MDSAPLPKILMFGWEFPPYNSGGLGVACEGLVNGLASLGAEITFVLPKKLDYDSGACKFVYGRPWTRKVKTADGVEVIEIDSPLSPYLTAESYAQEYELYADKYIAGGHGVWRKGLVGEAMRYAAEARGIVANEKFDLIHCHDWLSLPAGLEAKKASGKPLVFQVHATEYDRVNDNCMNRDICAIEKQGLEEADIVVAVSDYTRRKISDCYHIDSKKIEVVPNAVDHAKYKANFAADFSYLKDNGKKIVLFVGRLTFQKGPDYFLKAAQKVSRLDPDVMFVFSGAGDMERWLIEESAKLGIADKVIFAGFLRGNDLARLYRMADLYVMPSVSEPFGITSLEALANGTPILVSRQSGVAEMISHCLKVDFWDTDQIANKIMAVVKYPALRESLHYNGAAEVCNFTWRKSAQKCMNVYNRVLRV